MNLIFVLLLNLLIFIVTIIQYLNYYKIYNLGTNLYNDGIITDKIKKCQENGNFVVKDLYTIKSVSKNLKIK
jgi:hypothetical protein